MSFQINNGGKWLFSYILECAPEEISDLNQKAGKLNGAVVILKLFLIAVHKMEQKLFVEMMEKHPS